MRATLLTVAALALLRIVLGLHFFLEGLGHLRDPDWSSTGFRRAAVGPFAETYRSLLPQTGDWSGTLGAADARSGEEAAKAWQESVVVSWQKLLAARTKALPLDAEAKAAADKDLEAARDELAAYAADIADDLGAYRLQVVRLAAMERKPGATQIPFERDRVAQKRKELAGQAAGWMAGAAAIGRKLEGRWDDRLPSDADRNRVADALPPSALYRGDRFVSWSLLTIGACLVLGLFVKFNAMGGACFLATVVAAQPFWVTGAQPTYNQWVELAALLAVAALPTGGWSGLDYFLPSWCPMAACCRRGSTATPPGTSR